MPKHIVLIYIDSIGTSLMNEKRYHFIVAIDDDFMRSPTSDTQPLKGRIVILLHHC